MRNLLLIFFALLAAALPASGASAASPLVLNDLGRATSPVDGEWQFQTGDNRAWAAPGFDDSGWAAIQTSRSWEGQRYRNYTGFAWYRRHVVIAPGDASNMEFSLLLAAVESSCDVYWNGVWVGSVGRVPPHPAWYLHLLPRAFPLGPARSGVLAIRVWKAPYFFLSYPEEGGLVRTPLIGDTSAITNVETAAKYEWLRSNQYSLALVLLSTVVALMAALEAVHNFG